MVDLRRAGRAVERLARGRTVLAGRLGLPRNRRGRRERASELDVLDRHGRLFRPRRWWSAGWSAG